MHRHPGEQNERATMQMALYLAFLLSGASGLIYESTWTRYIGLFVGHSAYAQAIVLVLFLGGMSIGALLVGRRAERLKNPLQAYALVEGVVGLMGICFHSAYISVTDLAYATIYPALGVGMAQTVVQWTLAGCLLLPQAVLLGTTFPLMSAGVVRRAPENAGRTISLLYFANSLGAALGVLLAGFVLVAWVGLPGTLMTAGLINLGVAIAVYGVARRDRQGSAQPSEGSENPVDVSASGDPTTLLWRLLLAVSFCTALSSFIYEIAWIRMLALVLGSATHAFELMLSAFILGLALGAFWIRGRADRQGRTVHLLGMVQLIMGTLAIATLPVYVASFHWMTDLMAAFAKTPEGYVAFSLARYGICLAVMLPATFCAGMTLPLVTRALVGGGTGERAIGQVYGVNTLGSIVGAGLAGLVLLPVLGLKGLLFTGASVDVGLGIVLLAMHGKQQATPESRPGRDARWAMAGAVAAMLCIALFVKLEQTTLTSGVYRNGTLAAEDLGSVRFYEDGRTATVSVRVRGGVASLATNGKPDASMGPEWLHPERHLPPGPFDHDMPAQFFIPTVALAHAPWAREAAVVGQGSGMTSHVLLASPRIQHLVTIEIEPEMIRASKLFYPANRRAFDDPRSTVALDDARTYFAARQKQFDLIISEPSNPWVSGVSGLFTQEYYQGVRRHLSNHGVFAQWLHLYEIDDSLVLGVIAALSRSFPSYSVFQIGRGDILIVASKDKLAEPDWSVIHLPGNRQDLQVVWPITAHTMETLRVADAEALAPLIHQMTPNSDFFPALDLNAERTRYLKKDAKGLEEMAAARVNIAAMLSGRRNGLGDSYAVVKGIDRLTAMAENAGARNHDPRAGPGAVKRASQGQLFALALSTGVAPLDWRTWLQTFAEVEESTHGGMAGVADEAFYATVRGYLAKVAAPPPVPAAVDFMHGMATWDYAEVARAADPLLQPAAEGDPCLDPDVLRDGAVLAQLAIGHRSDAARSFAMLANVCKRPQGDLRTLLLYAQVVSGQGPRLRRDR